MAKQLRAPEPGPPWHLNQCELIGALSKEVGRQLGDIPMIPRYFNVLIAAADQIVEEYATPYVEAKEAMGLSAWLASDDVGMSSKWMAYALSGRSGSPEYRYPLDPSDFGRCLGLLKAAPELRAKLPMLRGRSREWTALVDHWDELESLYNEELPSGRAPKTYARMKELYGE